MVVHSSALNSSDNLTSCPPDFRVLTIATAQMMSIGGEGETWLMQIADRGFSDGLQLLDVHGNVLPIWTLGKVFSLIIFPYFLLINMRFCSICVLQHVCLVGRETVCSCLSLSLVWLFLSFLSLYMSVSHSLSVWLCVSSAVSEIVHFFLNSTQLKFIENGSRMAKGIQYIKTTLTLSKFPTLFLIFNWQSYCFLSLAICWLYTEILPNKFHTTSRLHLIYTKCLLFSYGQRLLRSNHMFCDVASLSRHHHCSDNSTLWCCQSTALAVFLFPPQNYATHFTCSLFCIYNKCVKDADFLCFKNIKEVFLLFSCCLMLSFVIFCAITCLAGKGNASFWTVRVFFGHLLSMCLQSVIELRRFLFNMPIFFYGYSRLGRSSQVNVLRNCYGNIFNTQMPLLSPNQQLKSTEE